MKWLVALLLLVALPAQAAEPISKACMAVLGDTQNYTSVSGRTNDELGSIVTWILANRVDAARGDIQLVLQLGDTTADTAPCLGSYPPATNCTSERQAQMTEVETEFRRLDGIIPLGVVGGNHDLDDWLSASIGYEYYGPSGRAETWVDSEHVEGSGADNHSWTIRPNFGGGQIAVVMLDFESDGDWVAAIDTYAEGEIDEDATDDVFLTTHFISSGTPPFKTGNANLLGHAFGHSAGLGGLVDTTDHDTYRMHFNEQTWLDGGSGWLHLICFDPPNSTFNTRLVHSSTGIAASGGGTWDQVGTWNWSTGFIFIDPLLGGAVRTDYATGGYLGALACRDGLSNLRYDIRTPCTRVLGLVDWQYGDSSVQTPIATLPRSEAPDGSRTDPVSADARNTASRIERECTAEHFGDPWTLFYAFQPDVSPAADDTQVICHDGTNGFEIWNSDATTTRVRLGTTTVDFTSEAPAGAFRFTGVRWGTAAEPTGTGGLIKLYVNGTLDATSGAATLAQPVAATRLRVGRDEITTNAADGVYHDFHIQAGARCDEDCLCYLQTCGVDDSATKATRESTYGSCGAIAGPQDAVPAVTDCGQAVIFPRTLTSGASDLPMQ